jgi:ATP-dependent Clp protease, protease subunit
MVEDTHKSTEIWVTAFTEESAQKFREMMIMHAKHGGSHPIVVYIDSYGGQVDSLAKMIETMDEVSNPIVTVCMGKAMSCGAILLSHGDVRFCGRHSRVMIHEVSSGTIGDVHDMHADVEEVKRLNQYFLGLLAKNCGYNSYSELRKLIKEQDGRDRYLDAKSAVDFGIVDIVGLPRVHSSATHEVSVVPEKGELISKISKKVDKKVNDKPDKKQDKKQEKPDKKQNEKTDHKNTRKGKLK